MGKKTMAKKMEGLKEEILELRRKKVSMKLIGEKYNININTIWGYLYFWKNGVGRHQVWYAENKATKKRHDHQLCKNCADHPSCKGINWDNCSYRGIIKKEKTHTKLSIKAIKEKQKENSKINKRLIKNYRYEPSWYGMEFLNGILKI